MSQNKTYSALVIGCGRIGSEYSFQTNVPGVHSHAQAFQQHPRTRLAGLADNNEAALQNSAAKWKTESDTNALALCQRLRPDIVSICTPDHTHAPLALEILSQSPPRILFIEKPLALNSAEGEAILRQAKATNTALAVNFTRRYIPIYRLLKEEIVSGRHGRPLHARITYSKGLLHAGSHAVDMLRFWLGEPVSVHGRPFSHWGPDGDPTYSADLLFPGAVTASLNSFDDRSASVFEIDLFFEKSRFTMINGGLDWRFYEAKNGEAFAEYREYLPSGRENREPALKNDPGALLTAVENIVEFLDGSRDLICSGDEGLKTLQLVEKIQRANAAANPL